MENETGEVFKQQNDGALFTGTGYLVFHVTTARGAIPLAGARVTVREGAPEGSEGGGGILASVISGRDGNTITLPLSAPPKRTSLTPGEKPPYATVSADVFLEGYAMERYFGVPIFDGITAIQPADLIPLPENGKTDSFTPDGERNNETVGPDL